MIGQKPHRFLFLGALWALAAQTVYVTSFQEEKCL